MDITRRNALTGIAAISASTAASCSKDISSNSNPPESTLPNIDFPPLQNSLLLNQERAKAVMEEADVDLLLCGNPINIYYLTNQRSVTPILGMHGFVYASIAAKNNNKPSLIEGQIGYYFTTPPTPSADLINRKHYGLPENIAEFVQLTEAKDFASAEGISMFRPRIHDVDLLSPSEARRHKLAFESAEDIAAGVEGAIFRELLDTDMPNKTIAIDVPILRDFVERSGLDLRIVDGERLIRNIRLQKTPNEIEFMRYAAQKNANAAHSAALSIRDGATFQELRREYMKNCGSNSMAAKYMMIDTVLPNMTPGEIKEGRAFLIDCVSDFEGYHGDYGRTVCVGEPNARMAKIIQALSDVWDRTLPELKVGAKYSDLHALTARLIKEANIDTNLAINPHSVGLNHTDEPSGAEFSYFQKQDLTLQKNMVLSIDMPLLDTGLGGSAHLEDLVLITEDGPELLNRSDNRFITV